MGATITSALAGFFRSNNLGASWASFDLPGTCEGTLPNPSPDPQCTVGTFAGIHPGGQGLPNTSLAADPVNPFLVYIGGDTQPSNVGPDGTLNTGDDASLDPTHSNASGATTFGGRLFRCDSSKAPGAKASSAAYQCRWITDSLAIDPLHPANGTSPHGDTRAMAFEAAPSTTLQTGINSTDMTIVLSDASAFPVNAAGGERQFVITIGTEQIRIASRSGNTLTVAVRNYNNTPSASHAAGATVTLNGSLIEGDDGGIYIQTFPKGDGEVAGGTGHWVPRNGGEAGSGFLQITEHHSCAYDHLNRIIVCGNQDAGTTTQSATDSTLWTDTLGADGNIVAVGYDTANNVSFRYIAFDSPGGNTIVGLSRVRCTNANVCTFQPAPAQNFAGPNAFVAQFYTPIAANPAATTGATAGLQIVVGGDGGSGVWESLDGGNNFTQVPTTTSVPLATTTLALVYGGFLANVAQPNVLLWGDSNGRLYFRDQGSGTAIEVVSYTAAGGLAPVDIALDPDNYKTVYVTDRSHVWFVVDITTAATAADWKDITGDLTQNGVNRIISLATIGSHTAGSLALAAGTEAGLFITLTATLGAWTRFGANLPATFAFDVTYDAVDGGTLVVGTVGRGAWKLTGVDAIVTGPNHLYGVAPSDQTFTLRVPVDVSGPATSRSFIVGSKGKFAVTVGSNTTAQLAFDSDATIVQAAIGALSGIGTISGVIKDGITFTVNGTGLASFTVDVFLTGTAPRALTPAAFAIGLETAVNNVLSDAGIDGSVTVTLTSSGFLNITTTKTLELDFARPVVVDTPVGTRITLLTPGTTFTLDADTTPLTITRVLQINLKFSNPAYQELGLTTTPTRFVYDGLQAETSGIPDDIQLTLNITVGGVTYGVPVFVQADTTWIGINDLIKALQDEIDTSISASGLAPLLDASNNPVKYVTVCRGSVDPSKPCGTTGNRVMLRAADMGIEAFSIDVPRTTDAGDPNGAITELGFTAAVGEVRRSRASKFFLEGVHLDGIAEVVAQNVSATASLGFLALKLQGSGTVGARAPPCSPSPCAAPAAINDRLVSVAAQISLKNPLAGQSGQITDRVDLDVLVNAINDGKFFWNAGDAASGGTAEHPNTGFINGTLPGSFGVDLRLAPDGALAGLGDDLSVTLKIKASSTDWLQTPVSGLCASASDTNCLSVEFDGPNFDDLINRFKNLDFASIIHTLRLVVDFVRSLNEPGTATGEVLGTKLPLINRSLGQLLDVASSISATFDEIASNPAGAIQKLNTLLANALNRLPAVQFTGVAGNQVVTLANVGTFALSDGSHTTIDDPVRRDGAPGEERADGGDHHGDERHRRRHDRLHRSPVRRS